MINAILCPTTNVILHNSTPTLLKSQIKRPLFVSFRMKSQMGSQTLLEYMSINQKSSKIGDDMAILVTHLQYACKKIASIVASPFGSEYGSNMIEVGSVADSGRDAPKPLDLVSKPLDLHWKAVKHILRYLKGSINQGLKLQTCKDLSIKGFADADWASDSDDRRSTTGYCIYLGSNPVSWCSKKQPTVSRSSTEAEYRSVASTAAEIIWLRSLLKEIKVDSFNQPVIWCDNSGAVSISANPVLHSRTKHIEIDLYFVREQVIRRELVVNHIPASHQIADIMTKALSKHNFERFKASLMIDDIGSRFGIKEEKNKTLGQTEGGN